MSDDSAAAAAAVTTAGPTAAVIGTLDALPYIDPVHEDYEQYALALIEQEMNQMSQSAATAAAAVNVSDILPVRFRTEIFREEYHQLEQERFRSDDSIGAMMTTTMKVADFFASKSVAAPLGVARQSAIEWKKTLRQAQCAFESERIRTVQLEVAKATPPLATETEQDASGSEAVLWKIYNELILVPEQAYWERRLVEQRHAVDDINLRRQEEQQQWFGTTLGRLESQYHGLVQKQFQLRHAINELAADLDSS